MAGTGVDLRVGNRLFEAEVWIKLTGKGERDFPHGTSFFSFVT